MDFPRLDRAMRNPVSAARRRRRSVFPCASLVYRRGVVGLLALRRPALSGRRDGGAARASDKRVLRSRTGAPRGGLRLMFSRSDLGIAHFRNLETAHGLLSPPGYQPELVRVPLDAISGWSLGARSQGIMRCLCRAGSGYGLIAAYGLAYCRQPSPGTPLPRWEGRPFQVC
jgi:hypothetical protein